MNTIITILSIGVFVAIWALGYLMGLRDAIADEIQHIRTLGKCDDTIFEPGSTGCPAGEKPGQRAASQRLGSDHFPT
jgi:hypothetical protein